MRDLDLDRKRRTTAQHAAECSARSLAAILQEIALSLADAGRRTQVAYIKEAAARLDAITSISDPIPHD